MATIYLPEDPRSKMIATALAEGTQAFFRQQDATKRATIMRQMFESGQQDPFALASIAAGNPESEALLKGVWAQQASQTAQGLERAQKAHTEALTAGQPMVDQLRRAQAAKEIADTQLAGLRGELSIAQTALARANTSKIPSEIAENRAKVAQLQSQIQTAQIIKDLVSGQQAAYGNLTPSVPNSGQVQPGGSGSTPQSSTPPPGTSGEITLPPVQGRMSEPLMAADGTGYPPGTDLNRDPASQAMSRLRAAQTQVQRMENIPAGTSLSSGGMRVSRPAAIGNREATQIAADTSLAETLAELQRSIVTDKDGKLHLDPISGRVANLLTKYKDNPNDPDIVARTLIGHLGITTVGLLPNARFGAQIMGNIQAILADATSGKGIDLSRIGNSARVLRSSMAAMADAVKGKSGVNLDQFDQIDQLTKQITSMDYKRPYKNIDPTSIDPEFTDDNLEAIEKATGLTREQILERADQERRKGKGEKK